MINIISIIIINYIIFNNQEFNYLIYSTLFSLIPYLFSFQILNIYNLFKKEKEIPKWFTTLRKIFYSIFIWIPIILIIFFVNKFNLPTWTLSVFITILFDILTHNSNYFPTPFLWPFSDIVFNGFDIYNNKLNLGIFYIIVLIFLVFLLN